MIIIYSDKPIKSIAGVYCSPRLFDGVDTRATVVYAQDEKIKKAYSDKGVEVKGFPRTSPTPQPKPTEK